jgi:hypothetical protein
LAQRYPYDGVEVPAGLTSDYHGERRGKNLVPPGYSINPVWPDHRDLNTSLLPTEKKAPDLNATAMWEKVVVALELKAGTHWVYRQLSGY